MHKSILFATVLAVLCFPALAWAACGDHPDKAACMKDLACLWSGKTCKDETKDPDCSFWDGEDMCDIASLCVWVEGKCTGLMCVNFTTREGCQSIGSHLPGGCLWTGVGCLTTEDGTECDVWKEPDCNTHKKCKWSGIGCEDEYCDDAFTRHDCSLENQLLETNCTWSGVSCHMPEHILGCGFYVREPACLRNVLPTFRCEWSGSSCKDFAVSPSCNYWDSERMCLGHRGCIWNSINGAPKCELYLPCSEKSHESCGSAPECVWFEARAKCIMVGQCETHSGVVRGKDCVPCGNPLCGMCVNDIEKCSGCNGTLYLYNGRCITAKECLKENSFPSGNICNSKPQCYTKDEDDEALCTSCYGGYKLVNGKCQLCEKGTTSVDGNTDGVCRKEDSSSASSGGGGGGSSGKTNHIESYVIAIVTLSIITALAILGVIIMGALGYKRGWFLGKKDQNIVESYDEFYKENGKVARSKQGADVPMDGSDSEDSP